jgi:cytochrome c-type biogenesis protein CcmE
MTPQKKQRVFFLFYAFISLSIGGTLLLFVLKDNLMYFYVPSELIPLSSFYHKKIRLGGTVKKGSISHKAYALDTSFIICDQHKEIKAHYKGILPDLFREGQGVIAEGILTPAHIFEVRQILIKHDENYMPAHVAQSLNKLPQEEVEQKESFLLHSRKSIK